MKKTNAIILGIVGVLIFSCQEGKVKNQDVVYSEKSEMLFEKGKKVPNDKFVGNVYQAILSDEETRVSNVTFEPKGRTN